jgi:DNA-binding winged helix-turn-helix (wHTH) protein/TolB-like protein
MRPKLYAWGEWRFEPVEYRLRRGDEQLTLPGKTLDLLAVLVSRAPRLATKAEILGAVWPDAAVEEGNIAFHVAALRKVLDSDEAATCIETVRGRGYRFVAPLVVTPVITPPSTPSLDLPADVRSMPLPAASRSRSGSRSRTAMLAVAIAVVVILIGAIGTRAAVESRAHEAVLVMPFAIGPSDANTERLDVSLAQFIVTALSEAGVEVVPMDEGVAGESARAAAERLGASAVVTGELQTIGENQWRVSLRLILADDGKVAWHWIFDAPPRDDRNQLQNENATAIAAGLQQRLAAQLR